MVTILVNANLMLVFKAMYSQGLIALFARVNQNPGYMTIGGMGTRNVVISQKR